MNKLSKLVEEFERNSQEQSKNIEAQLTKDFQRHESVINDALAKSENSILNGIETHTHYQMKLLHEQSKKMKIITENIRLNVHAESVEKALKTNEGILLKAVTEQNKRFNMLILKTWAIIPLIAMFITLILAAMSWHYTNQLMEKKENLAELGISTLSHNGTTYLVLPENFSLMREGKNNNNQEIWTQYQRK